MNEIVYIASPEGGNGRNVVAYGVLGALSAVRATGVFRPLACRKEEFSSTLLSLAGTREALEDVRGVCPGKARENRQNARGDIVAAYHRAAERSHAEAMVVVGSDKSNVVDPQSFGLNAEIAADLQAPVLLAVCTMHRNGREVKASVDACTAEIQKAGSRVAGVFITGCDEHRAEDARLSLQDSAVPVWTIPAMDFPGGADDDTCGKALATFNDNVDSNDLLAAIRAPFQPPTTPYAFQYSLLERAKAQRKTIVLPEGDEDRIITAADYLLERDIVDLIIVGDRESILERGRRLGLKSLDKATFQSINDETVLTPMMDKLCELRAKKGMTRGQARETLRDASYFGTMLVVLGKADGLVSGSINSTANTVRPALQVIKTKPGSSLVSGAFLMCFPDHVAVFADCAINVNPDARQLADIAMQSAATARSFGIDPHVGMLSYSTLGSGKGPDVDLVEEATRLVKAADPDLPVVGSIQFDAAWSPTVASVKAKGNDVAGHVNVFVFPDLCAGNIAYKAVQRSSGALAVGPVLQGLNKPVNDLSRGALVQDIINTVALTAIEAQETV
ncbi:MAG: phosphate acetyltransferase [Bifidobacterium sp.]|jgi:phosphate acetyltransferase|nr:phosphate acetyltransferase [Bifidobacterium sp.]MCI1865761.1 phosphate acetyltransferase [Bifidobacterium sp.]